MPTVKIKKGAMQLVETDRQNLVDVNPTYDGIDFTFKNNIHVYCTDQYLTNGAKEIMRNTSNSFPAANLEFDLANYAKPVIAEVK